ncbi:MAG: hypothetical protein WA735_17670 [Candidatus Acidiferrales bacterium]
MRALRGAPFVALLMSLMFAQRIDPVDLTRGPESSKMAESLPNDCKKASGGMIADGWLEPENHVPLEIAAEVVRIEDMKPVLGSKVTAEVRLRNTDARPIKIPWRTDFATIRNGQGPDALQWEEGTFEFRLKDAQGRQVWLKSLTASLYGAKTSPGSQTILEPGGTVTALVKFKLEEEFPIPPLRLKPGDWELMAKWTLTGRSWAFKNCSESNVYLHDDQLYQQQNPGLPIQVTVSDSVTNK